MFVVTFATYCAEIIEPRRDLRSMNVERRELLDVVNDCSRLIYSFCETIFAKIMCSFHILVAAILPRLRRIELFRKLPSHYSLPSIPNSPQRKSRGISPTSFVLVSLTILGVEPRVIPISSYRRETIPASVIMSVRLCDFLTMPYYHDPLC